MLKKWTEINFQKMILFIKENNCKVNSTCNILLKERRYRYSNYLLEIKNEQIENCNYWRYRIGWRCYA